MESIDNAGNVIKYDVPNEIASWYDFEKLESKVLQKIYQGRRSTENNADFVLDIRETLM